MESDQLLDLEIGKKSRIRIIILLPIIAVLLALTICFIVLYVQEKNKNSEIEKEESPQNPQPEEKTDYVPDDGPHSYNSYIPLSSWNDCAAKRNLSDFIAKINSADHYVPKEDRVAVFDLDGTLFQETDPTYDDWKLYYWRVYNDTSFTSTEEQRQIADAIHNVSIYNVMPDDLNARIARTYTQLFYNMTIEDYQQYILDFVSKPAEGYNNMRRGDAFYKPMLELIEYIQKNDFQVYITSGTDRYQVRAKVKGHIDIPESNIIGSDYEIVAKHEGSVIGNEYTYVNDDDFRFNGTFLRKNLKTNKVIGIIREIGKHPILSFGNSGGDRDMANYVINKNKHPSLAFMVCCDDTERERGNTKKADEMKKDCATYNWIPISMRDDWKTIYGEHVTKKPS